MAAQRIDLVSTRTFRVCSALSAGVLAFLGLVAIAAAGKVGRAHPELLLAGVAATTFVWTAATVVFRAGLRRAVTLDVDDGQIVVRGVMLAEPLRLAKEDVLLTAFDERKVRASAWRFKRFRVEGAGDADGWLHGTGRRRAPLPLLNVESFSPNVAIVFTRPIDMPRVRPLFRFFLGRYPYHGSRRGPVRGLSLAARDLARARAALRPFGVARDPMPVDLDLLRSGVTPSAVPLGA